MHNYPQGGYGYNRQGSHNTRDSGVITEWAYGLGYWCGKVQSNETGERIFVDGRDFGGKLFKGDRISFNITQGQRGSKAINVSKESSSSTHEAQASSQQRAEYSGNRGRSAGVLYFQTGFYDKQQMEIIKKKFGQNYHKGPKMLFGDNYADRFRPKHTKRNSFGGQSQVMGHYDRSFGYGIPTTFNEGSGNQSFDGMMAQLFGELGRHLRNGGDVIIPYPSKQDLKDRPTKYFKSKYMGLSKTDQLIKHNLGTGISSLPMDQLIIIQKNIDKLKDIARRHVIVNQVLYNNDDYNRGPQQRNKSSSKIGGLFYQTEWFTKEQMQHIENKYNVNSGPIMLFNDNDTDKKRWTMRSRSDFSGRMAKVMGEYDRSYAYGITTSFNSGYIPNLTAYQQIIDGEFKTIMKHLMNGRDVVIPAPSAKDIQHNQYKYYRDGQQVIFHNLGEDLPSSHVRHIQRKVTELKRSARVSKVVDYYDFNAAPKYKREQRQRKQYGSGSNKSNMWTCSRCYKTNDIDAVQCSDCLSPKQNANDDNYDDEKSPKQSNKRRGRRRRRNSCSSDEESEDSQLDENELRKRWNVSSEIEIYSKKQQQWFKGRILNIDNDDDGEYLSVEYFDTVSNKTRTKDVERFLYGEVRPIKKAKNKRKISDILEIDVDELGIEDPHELLKKFEEQNSELLQLRKQEQRNHDFALKEAELEHKTERSRLKTILKGKELKLKELENKMTLDKIERQKLEIKQKAERERIQQEKEQQRQREINQRRLSHLNEKIKHLESFVDESGVKVCWEWKDDANQWQPFDNEHVVKQLNAIPVNQKGMIFMNGTEYEIIRTSKDGATQTNLFTKASRDCRRRVVVAQQISWEWQENNGKWIQYSDNIAKSIEKLNSGSNNNKYSYTFAKNNQTYEITRQSKEHGVQINVKTNVSRKVRRILSGDDGANIYPHFWDMSKIKRYDQAEIVDIPLTTPEAKEIIKNFNATCPKNIVKLEAIMNQCLFDRYTHERDLMLKRKNGDKTKLNERDLYHGTNKDNIVDVVKTQGFRKEFTTVAAFGEGTYFARDAKYSANQRYASQCSDGVTWRMFICKVLCGESVQGAQTMVLKQWPTINGVVVDSLCNNPTAPAIFVMHDDSRIYPMWIVYFR